MSMVPGLHATTVPMVTILQHISHFLCFVLKLSEINLETMKFSMNLMKVSLMLALSMSASTAFAPQRPSRTSKDLVELSASVEPKAVMPYGEGSRAYRRTFFTHKDWLRHRSEDRFVRTVFSTVRSGVVRQLAKEVGFVTATAVFVVVWNVLTGGFSDLQGIHHDPILGNIANLELPIAPFTLSSPALGLLLGEFFVLHISTCFVIVGFSSHHQPALLNTSF